MRIWNGIPTKDAIRLVAINANTDGYTICLSTCRKLDISALIEAIFLRLGRQLCTARTGKVRAGISQQKIQSCKNATASANIFYRPAISANRARGIVFITSSLSDNNEVHVCACAMQIHTRARK